MIDIGVNLTNARFEKDRTAVITRAISVGVKQMIITGTNIEESKQALALCHGLEQQFPNTLFSTAGVHPHDADNVGDHYLSDLQHLAAQKYVQAIGECGLDFNRNFSSPKQQITVFEEQIQLAIQVKKPLFLHQRDAFDTWLALLKPYVGQVPAMIAHCFTGNKEELMKCLNEDMYIGITGWLCDERRGKALQEAVSFIPLNRILIETDAPYLTPRTIRPKPKSSRNEPSYLPYIVQKIADITGVDPEEIACQTSTNAQQVFNLPS